MGYHAERSDTGQRDRTCIVEPDCHVALGCHAVSVRIAAHHHGVPEARVGSCAYGIVRSFGSTGRERLRGDEDDGEEE